MCTTCPAIQRGLNWTIAYAPLYRRLPRLVHSCSRLLIWVDVANLLGSELIVGTVLGFKFLNRAYYAANLTGSDLLDTHYVDYQWFVLSIYKPPNVCKKIPNSRNLIKSVLVLCVYYSNISGKHRVLLWQSADCYVNFFTLRRMPMFCHFAFGWEKTAILDYCATFGQFFLL